MGAASWRVPHGPCYTSTAPAPTGIAGRGASGLVHKTGLWSSRLSSSIEHLVRISRPVCVSCVPSLAQRCGRVKNTSKGFSPARLSLLVAIDVPIWTYVIHSNFIRRPKWRRSLVRASEPASPPRHERSFFCWHNPASRRARSTPRAAIVLRLAQPNVGGSTARILRHSWPRFSSAREV